MKAVILAAGLGTRIRSATNGLPKCLLQFGSRAILDFQLDSLCAAGVSEIAVVLGHGKEHIVEHIAHRHAGKWQAISFITNPRYAVTNNIYSLWQAREWVAGSDFICLNADVLYDPRIIGPAVETRADISVIIDPEFRHETMKVMIQNGQVVAMSKAIPQEHSCGTYIGITTFSRRASKPLFAQIGALLAEGLVNEFFNTAVMRLITKGFAVQYTTTGGLDWAEVDDPDDLEFALTRVYPHLVSAPALASRRRPVQSAA